MRASDLFRCVSRCFATKVQAMGVTLKKNRDGSLRPYWYGETIVDGKRRVFSLGVRWRGEPPPSLRDLGDPLFEASRAKAQSELDRVAGEARQKGQVEHLTRRLIESKSGQKVEYVRLDQLFDHWRSDRQTTKQHLANCKAGFQHLLNALQALQAEAVCAYEVTRSSVVQYAGQLRQEFSPTTARRKLRMLKSAFARALPAGAANPFDPLPWPRGDGADEEVHRVPFTASELEKVLDQARKDDPGLYPLIVCVACTGLRLGDSRQLRWDMIDLEVGVIAVKLSKTGVRVEIPIFPPLRSVLEEAWTEGAAGFVWPHFAEDQTSHHPLSSRFKALVTKALESSSQEADLGPQPVPLRSVLPDVESAVADSLPESPRRARILDSLERYARGETVRTIERNTGRSRGQISGDLHYAQKLAGVQFMPLTGRQSDKGRLQDTTQLERPRGKRRASIRDWPALRTTWATLALSAGVPMEVVRLVTGHRTVEVVLAHYFKPQREHLRATLQKHLPAVLTGGAPSGIETAGVSVNPDDNSVAEDETAMLAAKVAAGTATAREKKRLAQLLAS